MIRHNAGRTEVKKMKNANREDSWDQVEAFFSGPTPATLAQWLKDKAEQLGLESLQDAPADIAQKAFTKERVEELMRLAFFNALSSSNLLKCDIQYENQAKKELRACDENEEGWKEFNADALWHHLLHRSTAEAKPGDGAPKLLGAYKLGRAEARLATGQRLTSDTKESLDSVFTQILGVAHNAGEPTKARDAQTTDAATAPNQIRRTPSRDYVVLQKTLQSMVGQSIRFLVETLLPDVDTTFTLLRSWSCGRPADGQTQASREQHSIRTVLARNGNSRSQSTSGPGKKEFWPDTD
eukprot:5180897-Pleurochrysis_carterae.AAC.4